MNFLNFGKRTLKVLLYSLHALLPLKIRNSAEVLSEPHPASDSIAESAGCGVPSCGEKNSSARCKYMNFLRLRKRTSGTVLKLIFRDERPQNGTDAKKVSSDKHPNAVSTSIAETDAKKVSSDKHPNAVSTSIAESAGCGVLSSGEKNFSVRCQYMNFLRPRKRTSGTALYAMEAGRSMIEMLGVLAIIGVLSVGAIAGYQKAMLKYKLNKQSQQITALINGGYEIKNKFPSNQEWTSLKDVYLSLDLIPKDMIRDKNTAFIYDVFGNKILLAYNPRTTSDNNNGLMFLEVLDPDADSCRNLLNYSKEMHAMLKQTYITFNTEDDPSDNDWRRHYGDQFCTGSLPCLRDLTIAKIEDLCTTNCNSRKECRIWILWQ